MENTSGSLLLLPDEIVYDILPRLPAKSLQRFKLVSKPWGSLISDPNFAESHLHRANTSHDKNMLRVGQLDLTMGSHPYFSFYSMDFDGSNRDVVTLDYDESNRDVVTLDYVFRNYHAQILGSCNDESRNYSEFISYFRMTYVIVCFDLKNEKFKEVELPEWATDEMKFCLGVLGGCLSISLDPQESFTEVWAMKEYGIPELD
ncbi:F-box and associated interaction domains-containing-like protein [Theobroma cacao]|uniref:F-box and associated interaction domains-containing-like protein n=1 Tax=Theobroma cacao TaxID=3641 RepID=A0A061ET70_THECC|nr:F-box and associated interaction domains-containing-like protein [Theobroma cacao]